MLNYREAITLVQFSFGVTLFSTGVGIIFYQYLLNNGDEGLRQAADAKIFYRIVAAMFAVFGTYASLTAFFR